MAVTLRSARGAWVPMLALLATASCSLGTEDQDSFPPIITWISPSGDIVNGVIRIEVEVLDDVGIRLVRFFVDGQVIGDKNAVPHFVNYDTTQKPDGPITLRVLAEDTSGNQSNQLRQVLVQNTPQ